LRSSAVLFALLLLLTGMANASPPVNGETDGFGSWLSVGKYASYQCLKGCGFAYLNSSGLTEYTMQAGSAFLTWRAVAVNSTSADLLVSLSATGDAMRVCPNCSLTTIPFSLNQTLKTKVELGSNTIFYNNTNTGWNVFWLAHKPSPGSVVDTGYAITNTGSRVQLTASVTESSTLRWPRLISLNTFMLNPFISVHDSYDPDAGYALELWMPGVPALTDDTLQRGVLKVNNQTITSIAGIPLAALLHLDFSLENIFDLTQTNISIQTGQAINGLTSSELGVATAVTIAIVLIVFAWRRSVKTRMIQPTRG